MLSNGYDVLRARLFEELRPFGGVEMFSPELGNELFISLGRVAVREVGLEVFVCAVFGVVHVARIPLVLGGGIRVDTPEDEDAELGVFVPLRLLIFDEGRPIRLVGAVLGAAIGLREQTVAFGVIFAERL